MFKRFCVILALLLLMSSCATQGTQTRITRLSDMETHFGSMVETVIDYETDGKDTLVSITAENPLGVDIEIWLVQTYSVDGSETIRRKRLSSGNDKLYSYKIRTSPIEEGIDDRIEFEFYRDNGEVLFLTKSIVNGYMENHVYTRSVMGIW